MDKGAEKQLFGFDIHRQWEYENGFYLTSHPKRLSKVLAQYELYKSIVNLPGNIVECGVLKGASLLRFCTFREMLESPYSRKIIGFDMFGTFPDQDDPTDQVFVEKFEGAAGRGISLGELEKVLTHKGFINCELIKGDVTNTISEYLENHPELKIALLHVDVDVYRPTVVILEQLFERVVSGGLIVLDDYAIVAGETRSVDEFIAQNSVRIEKLPISHVPSFVRKK